MVSFWFHFHWVYFSVHWLAILLAGKLNWRLWINKLTLCLFFNRASECFFGLLAMFQWRQWVLSFISIGMQFYTSLSMLLFNYSNRWLGNMNWCVATSQQSKRKHMVGVVNKIEWDQVAILSPTTTFISNFFSSYHKNHINLLF